jgi:hypothetical protein
MEPFAHLRNFSAGIFQEMSTSEWNFIAYSNGYNSEQGTFAMQNSLLASEGFHAQISPNIGEAFFKAIEVHMCALLIGTIHAQISTHVRDCESYARVLLAGQHTDVRQPHHDDPEIQNN